MKKLAILIILFISIQGCGATVAEKRADEVVREKAAKKVRMKEWNDYRAEKRARKKAAKKTRFDVIEAAETRYPQKIHATKNIHGLDIKVSYMTCGLYKLSVTNNTKYYVQLSWDESVYITTMGESIRILNGDTRRIHINQSQPNSIIYPRSHITKDFLNRKSTTYKCASPNPANPKNVARIILAFKANGRTLIQENVIKFIKVVK